jgi:predicted Zn-dependent protease with MMP-like domain
MRVGYIAMPEAPDDFERLVDESIEALPEWVHKAMDNVEVFVEDSPPPDQPTLLGVYQGVPLAKRGNNYTWAVPDRITLFRSTIEAVARGNQEKLREVISHVVAHEVAHHFGISDDRLKEIDAY